MTEKYHFGVPGYAVWTTHIIVGLFLIYAGWMLHMKKKLDKATPIVLIVLGVVVILYHAYLWLTSKNREHYELDDDIENYQEDFSRGAKVKLLSNMIKTQSTRNPIN